MSEPFKESESETHESQERLEQVRDLLFGETARSIDDRVAHLAAELERVEATLGKQASDLQAKLDTLQSSSVDKSELAVALRSLADAVERGEHEASTRQKSR